jgi:hypothetical protein
MDKEKPGDYEAQANKLNFRDPDVMAAAGLRTQRKFDELVRHSASTRYHH